VTVIDNAIYIDGKRAIVPPSLDQTFEELRTCTDTPGHCFCWIGLLRPSKSEIDAVAAEFNLHGLAVEDTIKAHQRPKRERYGDVDFIVLRPARDTSIRRSCGDRRGAPVPRTRFRDHCSARAGA
jgi:magnesium transporter